MAKKQKKEETQEFQRVSKPGEKPAKFAGTISGKKVQVLVKPDQAVAYDLLIFENNNRARACIAALGLTMVKPGPRTTLHSMKFDLGLYSQAVIDEMLNAGFDYFDMLNAGREVLNEFVLVLVPEADVEEAEAFLEDTEE